MIDSKTQELAQTEEDLAASKQNLADTQDALTTDQKFIADLKVRCANADAEFESRSKARNLELQGVAETIAILNSDEAHELFSKTVSFVQVSVSAERSRRRCGRPRSAPAARCSSQWRRRSHSRLSRRS